MCLYGKLKRKRNGRKLSSCVRTRKSSGRERKRTYRFYLPSSFLGNVCSRATTTSTVTFSVVVTGEVYVPAGLVISGYWYYLF